MRAWILLLFSPILTASVTSDEYHGSRNPPVAYHSYSPGYQDQMTEDEHRPFIVLPPNEGISEKGLSGGESYHTHSNRPGVLHSRYVATNFTEDPSRSSDPFPHSLQPRDRSKDSLHESQEGSSTFKVVSKSDAVQNIRRMDYEDDLPSESSQHAVYVLPPSAQPHSNQDQQRNQETYDKEDGLKYYDTASGTDVIHSTHPIDSEDYFSSEDSQHAVYSHVYPSDEKTLSHQTQERTQDQIYVQEEGSRHYDATSKYDNIHSNRRLDNENQFSSESSHHAVHVFPPNGKPYHPKNQNAQQEIQQREESRYFGDTNKSEAIHTVRPLDDEGHLTSASSQHPVYVLPPTRQTHHLPPSQEMKQDTLDEEDDLRRHYDATSRSDIIPNVHHLDSEVHLTRKSSQHAVYVRPPNEPSYSPTNQNGNQETEQHEESRYIGATSDSEIIHSVRPLDDEGHLTSASSQHPVYVLPPTRQTHNLPPSQEIKQDTLDEEGDLRRHYDATSRSDSIPSVHSLDREVHLTRKSSQHAVFVHPPTEQTESEETIHDDTSDHDHSLRHFSGISGSDTLNSGDLRNEQYQMSQESSPNEIHNHPTNGQVQEPTNDKHEEDRKNKTLDGNTPGLIANNLSPQHEDQSVDESIHRVTFVHPPRERMNDDIRNGLQRNFNFNSPYSGTAFIDKGGYFSNQDKRSQNEGPLHSSRNYSPLHETHGESRDGQQRNMFKKHIAGSSTSNHNGFPSNTYDRHFSKPIINSAYVQPSTRDIQEPNRGYHLQRERNQITVKQGEMLGVTQDPNPVQTLAHQPYNRRHQDCSHNQQYNRQRAGETFKTPQHSPTVAFHEHARISPISHSQSLDSDSFGSSSYKHSFEERNSGHNGEKKYHPSTFASANSSPVAKNNRFSSTLYDQSSESNPLESVNTHRSYDGSSEYNGETQRHRTTSSSKNAYPTANNNIISTTPRYEQSGNSLPQSSYNHHSHEGSNEHSGYKQPEASKLDTIFDAPIVIHNRILSNPHDQFTENTISRATYVDKPNENFHEKIPYGQRNQPLLEHRKVNPEHVIRNEPPAVSPNQPITMRASHETYANQPHGGITNDHFQHVQHKEGSHQNPSDVKPSDESHNRFSSHETKSGTMSSKYTNLHKPHEDSPDQVRNEQKEDLKYHTTYRSPSDVFNGGITSKRNEQPEKDIPRRTYVHQSYGASHEKKYENQKEALKYPEPTNNPPVRFQSSLSQSSQEHLSEKSTPHFDSHPTYDGEHGEVRVKHLHPMNTPHAIFHQEHPSNKHGQNSYENSYNEEALDTYHKENQERNHQQHPEHGLDSQPSSSVNHEIKFLSNALDQSSDASLSHTVVIKPPKKSYKENHEKRTEWKKHHNLHVVPFTERLDNYHSKTNDGLVQKPSDNTKNRHEFEDKSKEAYDSEFQGSTISQPVLLHSGLLKDFNKDVQDHNPPNNEGHLPYEEHHMEKVHDQTPNNYNYHSMNTYTKNDRIEEAHRGPLPKIKEDTEQHQKDDNYNHYASERINYSGERQFDNSHASVRPTEPPSVHHDVYKKTHQNEPPVSRKAENQQFDSQGSPSDTDEKGNIRGHHQHTGYVPYDGPLTRPQIIHEGFGNEVASVKVEPFGRRKAQPPSGFKANPYHNNQLTVEDHRKDNQLTQNRSLASNRLDDKPRIQHVSVNNELLRHPFGYAPFSSYKTPFTLPQEQVHVSKENRTKYAPDNYKSVTYDTRDLQNGNGNHNSIGPNSHQEIKRQEHQHSYQGSPTQVQEQRKENVRTYNPHNSTRVSTTLTKHATDSLVLPSNSYEGHYVRHHPLSSSVQHTENHNDLIPKESFHNTHSTSHDNTPMNNATQHHSRLEIDIRQPQYNQKNDYTNKNPPGIGASGESYQKDQQVVPTRPVLNNQIVRSGNNSADPDRFNVLSRPMSYEEHPSRDEQRYSSDYHDNTETHREHTSQAHKNIPSSAQREYSVSSPTKHDSVSFGERTKPDLGYQGGNHHQISTPIKDNSHHEYPLKSSFSELDHTPKPILSIHYVNESAPFAVTPVPKILTELLRDTNHHSTGLPGYFDSKHVIAPPISYQANPLGKPLLLQSGYKEDTHEISHAKNDLVHVRHSSQSGFHYGVLT